MANIVAAYGLISFMQRKLEDQQCEYLDGGNVYEYDEDQNATVLYSVAVFFVSITGIKLIGMLLNTFWSCCYRSQVTNRMSAIQNKTG